MSNSDVCKLTPNITYTLSFGGQSIGPLQIEEEWEGMVKLRGDKGVVIVDWANPQTTITIPVRSVRIVKISPEYAWALEEYVKAQRNKDKET